MLPAVLIARQAPIGIIDCYYIAIRESVNIDHDIGTTFVGLTRKEDTGAATGEHHVGEHPGGRFDMQVELQMAPILAPVMPQLIPGPAMMKLPQINELAQRRGVRAHRARRQEGRSLLILAQGGQPVQGQIQRLNPLPVEAPATGCRAGPAGRPARPLRSVRTEQDRIRRQVDEDHPENPALIDSR